MQFLYLLESIRNPVLDGLMAVITLLGDEAVFLVLMLGIFWCVSKQTGYYLMSVGFVGTIGNQLLKLVFRIPRPWVLDPNFTIVESARGAATGYSFPSGHTQNIVGTMGGILRSTRRRWVQVLCWALMILVPFSRMYLGVHTPKDVLVSVAFAAVLVFAFKPLLDRCGRSPALLYGLLLGMLLLAVAYTLYVECWPFPADIDPANLASGRKNAYTLLGAVAGMNLVHLLDDRWIHFDTKAAPAGQAAKLILGLVVVVAVRVVLKAPLQALFAGHPASDAVRYALVVLAAGALWPMTFPWFQRLGGGKARR